MSQTSQATGHLCKYAPRVHQGLAAWPLHGQPQLQWHARANAEPMLLQVKDGTGRWADVPLASNEVAVLLGQTAETATAGLFKAATSRVVCK